MPKVKFNQTRTVKAENGPTFEKGKTYQMSDGSAQHWVARGVGEVVGDGEDVAEPVTDKQKALKPESKPIAMPSPGEPDRENVVKRSFK